MKYVRAGTARHNYISMASINLTTGTSPAGLLRQIQDLFRELGLLGERLELVHRGRKYLAGCDQQAFAVYRRVENCHLPPGRSGWPVCLVTSETILDETSPPSEPEDEFASGLTLPQWLDLIEKTFRTHPS